MKLTFALSDSRLLSESFSIKRESRTVTTKKWAKSHANSLARYASMLYTSGVDKKSVIKTALTIGYGANIGEQIFETLSDEAIEKIATNIKGIY